MKKNYQTASRSRSKKQTSKSILLIAILMMSHSFLKAQIPSYVPTNGLVGWWPFNGNANDESGNGNNGTVNGATLTDDRFGNINAAYNFGTNKNISAQILNNSIYTITCWLEANNYSGGGNFCNSSSTIISHKSSGANGNGFLIGISNSPSWRYIICPGTINPSYNSLISSSSILSQWHFITQTIDVNANCKFYVDGILIQDTTLISFITPNNLYPFYIGSHTDGGTQCWFDGIIDDVGYWNRALTQQEITALYNGCQLSINAQPINQNITVNNNAQFTVSSSDPNATYQWQTDLGVGFQNLSSVGQYSGATNDTLTVSYVSFGNNNQPFRCIVSSGSCSDTSNVAVLTVNNNVGINEISANQLFSVYPNPTSTIINLKSDAQLIGTTYFIYDNLGKTILSGKITSENIPIDLNQLAEGNYLIGIDANGVNSKKQSFKVIK